MFAHSFWLVQTRPFSHWNLHNYFFDALCPSPYVEVLPAHYRIAAVDACSLAARYPLAYYPLVFIRARGKNCSSQFYDLPCGVELLLRGYAVKTILGSEGVLNGFLQYLLVTHDPVAFLLTALCRGSLC